MSPALLAPNLIVIFVPVALAILVLARPPLAPLRWPLVLSLLANSLWALGDMGTLLARDLLEKQASLAVLYTGTLFLPPFWWLLAVRFARNHGQDWAPSPWLIRVPFLFAGAAWLAMASNPLHGLFLTPVVGGRNGHHVLWHIATAGSYLTFAATFVVYLGLATSKNTWKPVRAQAAVLLITTVPPFVANAIYHQAWPWRVDPTLAVLSVTGLVFVAGIYAVRLFDLAPVSFRAVIQHDTAGVLLVDDDGRLRFANPAAGQLLEMELELDSHPLPQLAARLQRPDAEDPITEGELWGQARKTDGHGNGSLYRLRSGRALWLWVSLSPIPTRLRSRPAWCIRLEDVTRLKQIEDERLRLERRLERGERIEAIEESAGSLLLEAEDVLGTIQAVAEHGLAERISPQRSLEGIRVEARRGWRSIVGSLRALRDDTAMPPERGSVNGCIIRARDSIQPLLEQEGASVELALDPQLPEIPMDSARLEHALEHLIRIAATSGAAGARMHIATHRVGDRVRIVLSDVGAELERDSRDGIFEPLFGARDRRDLGSRRGFARAVVAEHGGSLSVRTSPASGTASIEIDLPTS